MLSTPLQDYARLVPYPVQKKLLSLLDGYHQGQGAGRSHEFLDMAEYKVGDDIADIDWKATARRAQPVVKRFESTAVLRVIVVADTGAAMAAAAPDGKPKAEVGASIIRAISWLVAAHGDLLGLVAGNQERTRTMPARAGIGHAETLLRVASAASTSGAPSDLLAVLRPADVSSRRSLIFVVTDESQITPATGALLRRMCTRHEVGLFLIEDFDPTQHEHLGLAVDIEGGPLPSFVEKDPVIEAQWRMHRRIRRREVEGVLDRIPVRYARVSGEEDVLDALLTVFGGERSGS